MKRSTSQRRQRDTAEDRREIEERLTELLRESARLVPIDARQGRASVRKVIRTAGAHGLDHLTVWGLVICADANRLLNRFARVDENFRDIEKLIDGVPESPVRGMALHALGRYKTQKVEYAAAISYLRSALEVNRRLGSEVGESFVLHSLGSLYSEVGLFDKGLKQYLDSLAIRERLGDRSLIVVSLLNVGIVYGRAGDVRQAEAYFRRALDVARNVARDDGEPLPSYPLIINSLGSLLLMNRRPTDAQPILEEALEIFVRRNDKLHAIHALTNLGHAFELMRKHGRALDYLRRAEAMLDDGESQSMIVRIFRGIGAACRGLGQHDEAIAACREGIDRYRKLRQTAVIDSEAATLYADLGELYAEAGAYDLAYECRKAESRIRSRVESREHIRRIAALEQQRMIEDFEKERHRGNERVKQAEEEADSRLKDLSQATFDLARRRKLLLELIDSIRTRMAKQEKAIRSFAIPLLNRLEETAGIEFSEQAFDEQLERVHRAFIAALTRRVPDLTPAEIRVCVLLRLNLSNKEIGELLYVSHLTIKTHRASIRRKMQLRPRGNLVATLMTM